MKPISKNIKLAGYSLLELIIAVAIISLLSLAILNSVFGLNILTKNIDKENNIIIHQNYGIDYILNEIDRSEYIIYTPIQNIYKEKWIGFTICKVDEKSVKEKYNIITFALDGNSIKRYSFKTAKIPDKLYLYYFKSNVILDNIDSFNGTLNIEKRLINIKLKMKDMDEISVNHIGKGQIYDE